MIGAIGFILLVLLINKIVIYFKRKNISKIDNNIISQTKVEKRENEYKSAIPITMGIICFLFVFAVTLEMENIFLRIFISSCCGLLGYRNTIYYIKKNNSNQ